MPQVLAPESGRASRGVFACGVQRADQQRRPLSLLRAGGTVRVGGCLRSVRPVTLPSDGPTSLGHL